MSEVNFVVSVSICSTSRVKGYLNSKFDLPSGNTYSGVNTEVNSTWTVKKSSLLLFYNVFMKWILVVKDGGLVVCSRYDDVIPPRLRNQKIFAMT